MSTVNHDQLAPEETGWMSSTEQSALHSTFQYLFLALTIDFQLPPQSPHSHLSHPSDLSSLQPHQPLTFARLAGPSNIADPTTAMDGQNQPSYSLS